MPLALESCQESRDCTPVCFLGESQDNVLSVDEPPTIPIDVAWDTGAVDHVASRLDVPGYEVQESPGSRAGKKFVAANGQVGGGGETD